MFREIPFTVGNPNAVFKILTENLYAHPLRTAIQEYLANARDAHREVGSEMPVEVSLTPSDISIRDYGPGLSPQRVEEVFVKLGETTKSEGPFTGQFGIGAKSAFAYCPAFIVETWVGGKYYCYVVRMVEGSGPTMTLAKEESSTEPTGTKVTIPLRDEDIETARQAVERAVYFWEEPVTLNHVLVSDRPKVYSHDGVHLVKERPELGFEGVFVVVDGIPYEVDTDVLRQYLPMVLFSVKHAVGIEFKPWDVQILASREAVLTDSDFTIRFLGKFISFWKEAVFELSPRTILWSARPEEVVIDGVSVDLQFGRIKVPDKFADSMTKFTVTPYYVRREEGLVRTIPLGQHVIIGVLGGALRRKLRFVHDVIDSVVVMSPDAYHGLGRCRKLLKVVNERELPMDKPRQTFPKVLMYDGVDGRFVRRELISEHKGKVLWAPPGRLSAREVNYLWQVGVGFDGPIIKCAKQWAEKVADEVVHVDDWLEQVWPEVLRRLFDDVSVVRLSAQYPESLRDLVRDECWFPVVFGHEVPSDFTALKRLYPQHEELIGWLEARYRSHLKFSRVLADDYGDLNAVCSVLGYRWRKDPPREVLEVIRKHQPRKEV